MAGIGSGDGGTAPGRSRLAAERARFGALWRLRSYVAPWRRQVTISFFAALLGVAASTCVPLVIEAIVNGPIKRGESGQLWPLFLVVLALGIAEAGLIAVRRHLLWAAVLTVERNIRDDFYAHLQRLDVAFHDRWGTGQLLSRATTDLSTIRRFFGFGAIYLVVNTMQYVAVLALLIVTYWPLGVIVTLATFPVIALARRFGAKYAVVSRRLQDEQGDLATLAEEAASGVRVTKAFGRGPWLTSGFLEQAGTVRGTQLEMVRETARFWSLLQLIPNLTMAIVVLLGGLAVAHGAMSLGAVVAFVALLVLLQWPVIDIGWILAMAEESATAAVRILEVLDTSAAVADRPGATPLVSSRGRLRFEGVGFRFPDAAEDVLHDVNLEIEPGETIAIVGATGSGKTVLTALPSRLHDVTAGRIMLDGVDIRDIELSSLRRQVATAFEDPVLFSMSVRENLVLGRPDATDADIESALDIAQAHFVEELPWGLDTRVGEQGLSLSGGQRQRLALARAVVARPSVLVLDDPLSALDVHTEALVEQALAAVLAETTGLLVVHRPSTVALADRVALLSGGTLVAVGTHSELMALPEYSQILSVDEGWDGRMSSAVADVDLDRWRGVKAEEDEELPSAVSVLLRRRTRRLIGDLLRPHRRSITRVAAAIVLGTGAQMAIPALVGVGIDRGISDSRHGHHTAIVVVTAAIVVCSLVQAALTRVFLLGAGRVGQDAMLELRRRVFTHFQALSLSFHERYTSGRMISRLTSDFDAINALLDAGLDTLVTASLTIAAVTVILLVLDWPLALVSLASLVPLLFLSRWYQRRSTVAYRRTREAIALVIVHFTESLRGIRAVQAFRREGRNDEIFQGLDERYRRTTSDSFRLLSVYWPGIQLIGNLTTAAVLFYGGYRVIRGDLGVGVLASFVLYLRQFFEPMAEVSQFYDSFQGAASGVEKLAGVLDERPAVPLLDSSTGVPDGLFRGAVDFRDVSFAYRAERTVIPDLTLHIPAGQTVSLLGDTGAGKSTLARLLTRFYDPVAGTVSIDGIGLPELAESDLRRAVAMVTQESFLFTGSIADNIAFGRPGASRAEIEDAGRAVGVDILVSHLRGGYDESVGKNGARLSAGQRQLIAFARALLADPAVLILDEASSSLDAPTERLVQGALRTVLADRTALIIAHRLSTAGIADRVLVMSDGRIIEDGTPAGLLEAGTGEYAALAKAWRDSLV